MKPTIIIVLLLSIYTTNSESNWSNCLFKLLNDKKPHQLILYKNQTLKENGIEINLALENILRSIPMIKIELSKNHSSKSKLASSTELVIFLQHETDNNVEIINFIDFYEKQNQKDPRKKCLVITESTEEVLRINSFEKILQYAWQKKFLDFTILEVNKNVSEVFFHTLNPFYNKTQKVKLSNDTEIFPNKLHDLNKHPFNLPIYSYEPYIIVEKDSIEKIKVKSFINDNFLLTTLKRMNFEVKYQEIDSKNKSSLENYLSVFKKLEHQDLNMGIVYAPLKIIPRSLPVLFLHDDCISYVGVMKYHHAINLSISPSYLISFALIVSFVYFIKWIIYLLKLTAFNFDVLDVLRIAVAIPLTSLPKTVSKRIILSVGLLFAMLLSAEFVGLLTKAVQVNEEVSFETIDKVYQSEFKLVTTSMANKTITDYLDEKPRELFSRHVEVNNSIKCPYYALERQKTICIGTEVRIKEAMKSSKNLNEIVRVLSLRLPCPKYVYYFEAGSPYISHIKLIFRRMYESGIFDLNNKQLNLQKKLQVSNKIDKKKFKSFLIAIVMLIFLFGTAISFIVFILEIIVFLIRSRPFLE